MRLDPANKASTTRIGSGPQSILLLGLLQFVLFLLACESEEVIRPVTEPESSSPTFSVDHHHLQKDGVPFPVKGVVYVPSYPGYLPWEIENAQTLPELLRLRIDTDLSHIQAMGANTVRLWGAPTYCYEALKKIGGLYILQTIWIDGEVPNFQDSAFKARTKTYIRSVIDRIHSVFPDSPPVLAYLVGNELSAASILATDAAQPEKRPFVGNYIQTTVPVSASEAFIAEMADYVKTYEYDTYGHTSLVSYANDIRTVDLIDTPFLDFISHNAYSYAVPYYRPATAPGIQSGTLFQGWLETLKLRHPGIPLLITETGLSVSPRAPQVGPPNYGYGGNSPAEQAAGIAQNLTDIETAVLPIAGVCIHEYLDAWWKFGLEDSYTQDPNDIEEWFGIVATVRSQDTYTTVFRESYLTLKALW